MPNDFTFTPATGLKDTNVYPDNPLDPRGDIQGLLDQLKSYMNTVLNPLFASGTLAAAGYIDIPIANKVFTIQWGSGTTGVTSAGAGVYVAQMPITFSKAFPTACLYADAINTVTSSSWTSCVITSLSGGTAYLSCPTAYQNDAANKAMKWWAIGY